MRKFGLLLLIIIFMISLAIPTSAATSFKDVKEYKEEIGLLTSKGIIKGYQDGTFKPEKPVLRLQAVQMILREMGVTDFSASNPKFTDIKPNDYGYKEVAKAVDLGIISGKTNTKTNKKYFDPYGTLTRAQMSKILVLAYELEDDYYMLFNDVSQDHWAYEFIDTLAANGITTGYPNGAFKPSNSMSRQHFAVFMARLLDSSKEDDEDSIIDDNNKNDELTTSEIVELNDNKTVLIKGNAGQGSGVLVGDGLILTNFHVMEGMTSGEVITSDGTTYLIEGIVDADQSKDLALIKTNRKIPQVKPVEMGTYTNLRKGEKVVAIGSPLGYQNTVSTGIVSSIRMIDGVQYVQTSAQIDHGSSGGGLFNTKGELVGITSMARKDNNADLNFAVAIDEAKNWNKYYTMNFDEVKVNPLKPPTPSYTVLPIDGFNNIALGMTMKEVKDIEYATLVSEDDNRLLYTNKYVFDFSADVVYEFKNNKLIAINVYHDIVEDVADLDTLEAYFNVFLNDISSIYGKPDIIDDNWFDDETGHSLSAYWVTDSHNVLMTVIIDIDYSTAGGLRISSQ